MKWAYTYLYEPTSEREAPAVLGPDRGAAGARVKGRASIMLDRETLVGGEVFDVMGRLVKRWEVGRLAPGEHLIEWDGTDSRGRPAHPGVHFLRLRSASAVLAVRRVLVLR